MEASYCIACRDKKSGKVGSFITNSETGETISPVFDSCAWLFMWMKENGWETFGMWGVRKVN